MNQCVSRICFGNVLLCSSRPLPQLPRLSNAFGVLQPVSQFFNHRILKSGFPPPLDHDPDRASLCRNCPAALSGCSTHSPVNRQASVNTFSTRSCPGVQDFLLSRLDIIAEHECSNNDTERKSSLRIATGTHEQQRDFECHGLSEIGSFACLSIGFVSELQWHISDGMVTRREFPESSSMARSCCLRPQHRAHTSPRAPSHPACYRLTGGFPFDTRTLDCPHTTTGVPLETNRNLFDLDCEKSSSLATLQCLAPRSLWTATTAYDL